MGLPTVLQIILPLIMIQLFKLSRSRCDIFRPKNLSIWQISVFRYGLLMRNRGYIKLETLNKQCWPYLRNIKTAINYFLQTFRTSSTHISHRKNLAEYWDLRTLEFSISKMSPQIRFSICWLTFVHLFTFYMRNFLLSRAQISGRRTPGLTRGFTPFL
jgi:hypothetical protein